MVAEYAQGGEGEGVDAKRLTGLAAGVALPAALMLAQPFAGLDAVGTASFAVLMGAIIWWVAGVLPDYVTAFAMAAAFVLLANVPASVVFSAFSTSTWWLLVAAFCLGLGMQRSGLLKRLAAGILGRLPRTFRAQATGLMAAGIVAGPFIPSLAAKCAILAPMALGVSDQMGYERRGRQANGLFLALFTAVRNLAPAVISASFVGYAVQGLLPAETQQHFDLITWFLAALPWLAVVTALNYLAIMARYEPADERARRRARRRGAHPGQPSARPESEDLGPMTRAARQMLAIMGVTVALWVLERFHGVPAYLVALLAVVAMALCGQLKGGDLRNGIAWDTIMFMGVVLGLAPVFAHTGVDVWIVGACAPVLTAFAGNPYAIVLAIAGITLALRFVIVSELAFLNIFMVFAVPLAPQLGISPWLVGFCAYAMVNPWFTAYQNPVYIAAVGSVDGEMTDHAEQARFCAAYMLICLFGLIVSVPYWQWMGLA